MQQRDLGRYQILGEVGSGGMATVYLGRLAGPAGFSRTVAIKQLHPQFARDSDFVRMFLDEARLAGRVQHPNVVPVLDVVLREEELYLVMEYVAGESLAQVRRLVEARSEGVPVDVAVAVVRDTLNGLNAAHEARDENGTPLGIVHRDVSPHNVLVGTDGVARILDFGVAKAMGRLQVTRRDQLKGKIGYMAPEQLEQKEVDRRADVYAASIVLWELLTGQRLFQLDDEVATLRKALEGRVPPLRSLAPSVPPELEAIVMRGLSRGAPGRYQTARAMAVALDALGISAAAHRVGEWLDAVAGTDLERRARAVATMEAGSGVPPGGSVARLLAEPATVVGTAASADQSSHPSSITRPSVVRARRRRKRAGIVTAALLLAAAASGGFALRARRARTPSVPRVMAHDPYNAPYGIALDADTVYWTSYRDGTVRAMPRGAGVNLQRLVAREQDGPRFLAVDERFVYWTNYDGGSVMRAPKAASADPSSPAAATELLSGLGDPWEIAVDERAVYVTVQKDGMIVVLDRSAARPAPRPLVSHQAMPSALALDATHVYWTNRAGGTVSRVTKTGGNIEVVARGRRAPDAMALDAEHIYFTEWDGGIVARVAKAGGAIETIAHGQFHPNSVAVDSRRVYWSTASNEGFIRRRDKRGGEVQTLAADQPGPVRLLHDGEALWWSLEYGRSLVQLGKDQL